MSPTYQRAGRLWSVTDKALLIDTVLNDFDIPKFYLADFTFGRSQLNEKRLPYAIIDGKQRFEALFGFMDNEFKLDPDFSLREAPKLQIGGLSYSELRANHPHLADKIDNYHLSVMRVVATNKERVNELFVRLNRSKPLTGAEIRNAMSGPVPILARELQKHAVFTSVVRFSAARGQQLNAATKVLLFEFHGSPMETKKRNLDAFVRTASRGNAAHVEQAGRRASDVLDQMSEVFIPSDVLFRSAGSFPVYYWLVRETRQKDHGRIREFLTAFTNELERGHQLFSAEAIAEYRAYDRSTNDEISHRHRINILLREFQKYLKS